MLKLTEAFKREYETSLNEAIIKKNYEESLKEFEDAQKFVEEGLEVIREYFEYFNLQETTLREAEIVGIGDRANQSSGESTRAAETTLRDARDTIVNTFSLGKDSVRGELNSKDLDYEPVVGHVKIQKITDMKFPQNVIFFFQHLISWLVNLVKKFVSFFTNAIQRFFGIGEGEKYEDDVKLNFQRSKAIESIAMPLSKSKDYTTKRNMPKAVSMVEFDPADYERLRSVLLLEASSLDRPANPGRPGSDPVESRRVIGLDINLSREMEGIYQLLEHFLDLFDNSYGSNREHLFETKDLELLVDLFNTSIQSLEKGRVANTAIAGRVSDLAALSADKLKDNLIRTKINTDNLKKVYVQIENAIKDMLAILNHKQLTAATSMGADFRFFSATTYMQMKNITDILGPRIKEARSMEKALKKMQTRFDKLVVSLQKQRKVLMGVGSLTYSTPYEKKVEELFNGSRFVSQTISLRLATLGLYIRQLSEIRDAIISANASNTINKNVLKKALRTV